MAYRKILCVLCGGAGDAAALATAFAVGAGFDAHVEALYIRRDPREAVPMLGEGVSGALVEQIMAAADKEGRDRANEAHMAFDAARKAAGADLASAPLASAPQGTGGLTAAWTEQVGRADEATAAAARYADLAVFPHIATDRETQGVLMLEAALLAGGRPVLVAPPAVPASVARHVAVAWNGSAEGARAVASGLPLLAAAEQVHILTVETGKTRVDHAGLLAAHLAWHGVHPRVRTLRPDGEPVGAVLLAAARDVGADLLMMGGYDHSRVREMILGGVTRHVLNHAGLPLFMAH